MPDELEEVAGPLIFACCPHCEHDEVPILALVPTHDTPCDHGCNDAELEAMQDA